MRLIPVAIFLATLALAVPPVKAGTNDCFTDAATKQVCVPISSVQPDPRVPDPHIAAYLFISGGDCSTAPASAQCHRIVYQESNGCPGLQRTHVIGAQDCQPDKVIVA